MNTWIDLERYNKELNVSPDEINSNFYIEILKPLYEDNS